MSSERDVFNPNRQYANTLLFLENSILGFLQALFGSFPPGHDPKLYHYDNDPSLTEIMIEGQGTNNLKTVDVRPKLVVTRGPVSRPKTHIGNFVGSKNLTMEHRKYASIYSSSVGISCFSREDLEADHLAQICFDAVEAFQFKLHKFGFLSINSVQIGARGLIKSDERPELSVTPVVLKVQVTKQWQTIITDPIKLRDIMYSIVVANP